MTMRAMVPAEATSTAQSSQAITQCTNGMAGEFPCENIDLLAHMPLTEIGGDPENGVLANDNWAWVSPDTGKEYVMVGLRDGTSFIDVSDPLNPVYIGKLPSHENGLSDYRDIKVYNDYAFIVGDIPYTAHGMQVFDLSKLDNDASRPPIEFTADAHYDGVGYGHNMWINEETGFAYIFRSDKCESGTVMVDINDPLNPVTAGTDGCLITDGADSDAECIIYNGPDTDHTGKEICFVGSDSTIGIADVTDKDNPVILANETYPNITRAHQGALTADGKYWLISDTMDEFMLGFNTRTIIIDITDLDNPEYVGFHEQENTARDHNVYVSGNLAIQSNWRAGLRVLDISDIDNWELMAYFDTYPENDDPAVKSGAWSHYDWLPSNIIVVSDVESGLFLLRIQQAPTDVSLSDFGGAVGGIVGNQTLIALTLALLVGATLGSAILIRKRA